MYNVHVHQHVCVFFTIFMYMSFLQFSPHLQTQTKIMIRGKGATKEGKLGRAGLPQPGEDEPLHALITGNTPEAVKSAVDKVSHSLDHRWGWGVW